MLTEQTVWSQESLDALADHPVSVPLRLRGWHTMRLAGRGRTIDIAGTVHVTLQNTGTRPAQRPTVHIADRARLVAHEPATIHARGYADVHVSSDCLVHAGGFSRVTADSECRVHATGESTVLAGNSAVVFATGLASVRAYENASVVSHHETALQVGGSAAALSFGSKEPLVTFGYPRAFHLPGLDRAVQDVAIALLLAGFVGSSADLHAAALATTGTRAVGTPTPTAATVSDHS